MQMRWSWCLLILTVPKVEQYQCTVKTFFFLLLLFYSIPLSPYVPDEDPRGELHEMLVPDALKEPWSSSEDLVSLSSYYIKFNPVPEDRIYRSFGLFVKAPLPVEAGTMELDLHLAHSRSVITKLVPSGFANFGKDEVHSCFPNVISFGVVFLSFLNFSL